MIEFFDTTALVAAMVEDEAHHEFCAEALENADDSHASTHMPRRHFVALAPDLAAQIASP